MDNLNLTQDHNSITPNIKVIDKQSTPIESQEQIFGTINFDYNTEQQNPLISYIYHADIEETSNNIFHHTYFLENEKIPFHFQPEYLQNSEVGCTQFYYSPNHRESDYLDYYLQKQQQNLNSADFLNQEKGCSNQFFEQQNYIDELGENSLVNKNCNFPQRHEENQQIIFNQAQKGENIALTNNKLNQEYNHQNSMEQMNQQNTFDNHIDKYEDSQKRSIEQKEKRIQKKKERSLLIEQKISSLPVRVLRSKIKQNTPKDVLGIVNQGNRIEKPNQILDKNEQEFNIYNEKVEKNNQKEIKNINCFKDNQIQKNQEKEQEITQLFYLSNNFLQEQNNLCKNFPCKNQAENIIQQQNLLPTNDLNFFQYKRNGKLESDHQLNLIEKQQTHYESDLENCNKEIIQDSTFSNQLNKQQYDIFQEIYQSLPKHFQDTHYSNQDHQYYSSRQQDNIKEDNYFNEERRKSYSESLNSIYLSANQSSSKQQQSYGQDNIGMKKIKGIDCKGLLKKNVIKNLMTSFQRFINNLFETDKKNNSKQREEKQHLFQKQSINIYFRNNIEENSIPLQETQQKILELYNQNCSHRYQLTDEKQFIQKFKRYMENKHFNQHTLNLLLGSSYSAIFAYYLEYFASNWLVNAKIGNYNSHKTVVDHVLNSYNKTNPNYLSINQSNI